MSRRKIVLYNPDVVFYTMPLALVAVGSHLDASRYRVVIVDGRLEDDPIARIREEVEDALCLGVTVLTGAPIRDALDVSRAARDRRPDLPVVWGGWHPSLFPEETLEESAVDVTVQAQGEVTFARIVESLDPDRSSDGLTDIDGIAYRSNGEIRRNPGRPMTAMEELTPHRYDLVPVERYFDLKGRRQLDYISSTGCFWRCAFCADPFVFDRDWTAIPPERMGAEIEELHRRYRFDELAFQDETFFTYDDRVRAIAEEFLERGLEFRWTATMRADQGYRLSEEDFAFLTRSGLDHVLVGVESGDPEMLEWMSKDATLAQVRDSARKCVRHDMGATFPFIVGFPGESEASVAASLQMAKELRGMSPRFETPIFYYKPYPGSEITRRVVENGYDLPDGIEEWARFDFVDSSGPWVEPEKRRRVERFKFYNRAASDRNTGLRGPLRTLAQWRCKHDYYQLPVEKKLVDWLVPRPELA